MSDLVRMSLIKRTSIRPHSPTDCAGEQLQRVATLALEAQAFVNFCGYWQRHVAKT